MRGALIIVIRNEVTLCSRFIAKGFRKARQSPMLRGRSPCMASLPVASFLAKIASFLGTFSPGEHYCPSLGGVFDFFVRDRRFMK